VKFTSYKKINGKSRRLYAGCKLSKDGAIEVKFRNQDEALKNLGLYFELLKGQSVTVTNTVSTAQPEVTELTDAQLQEIIAREQSVTNSSMH
jgi:hypothetical protein